MNFLEKKCLRSMVGVSRMDSVMNEEVCRIAVKVEDGYGVDEVRLDGCREGGLRQQRDDRRGCTSMRER